MKPAVGATGGLADSSRAVIACSPLISGQNILNKFLVQTFKIISHGSKQNIKLSFNSRTILLALELLPSLPLRMKIFEGLICLNSEIRLKSELAVWASSRYEESPAPVMKCEDLQEPRYCARSGKCRFLLRRRGKS